MGNANEYVVDGALGSDATLPKDLAYLPEVQAASRHYRYDPKSKSVQDMRNLAQVDLSEDEDQTAEEPKTPHLPVIPKNPHAMIKSPQVKTDPRAIRKPPAKIMGGTQPISPFQIAPKKVLEESEATHSTPSGLANICDLTSQAEIDAETGEQSGRGSNQATQNPGGGFQ
jgi:hypothetical protein